jgi:hypothetical protein
MCPSVCVSMCESVSECICVCGRANILKSFANRECVQECSQMVEDGTLTGPLVLASEQ